MEYPEELYKNDYACKLSRNNAVLLGFMLNTSHYEGLGFDCDGKNYVSVFTLEEENALFVEEYSSINKTFNGKKCKYVLYFMGNDDSSYGLRFKSREDRDQFLEDHRTFTEFIRTKCLYSN